MSCTCAGLGAVPSSQRAPSKGERLAPSGEGGIWPETVAKSEVTPQWALLAASWDSVPRLYPTPGFVRDLPSIRSPFGRWSWSRA